MREKPKFVVRLARTMLAASLLAMLGVSGGLAGTGTEPGQQEAKAPTEAELMRGFQGKIELDVRDSKPDWKPFIPKVAPKGAPNILFILYDDTGQAAWSPYGGRLTGGADRSCCAMRSAVGTACL